MDFGQIDSRLCGSDRGGITVVQRQPIDSRLCGSDEKTPVLCSKYRKFSAGMTFGLALTDDMNQ